MKKILLSLLLIVSIGAFAQITITSANMASIGDIMTQKKDSVHSGLSYSNIAGAGANKTWDFTSLDSTGRAIVYLQPINIGHGYTNFANADFVINSPNPTDTASAYFIENSTQLTNIGNYVVKNAVTYIDSLSTEIISFPSTYNTIFTHNLVDTIDTTYLTYPGRIIRHKNETSVIDGWGTAKMPNGNFPVLRQNITTVTTDSIQGYISNVWTPLYHLRDTTTRELRWWTNDPAVNYQLVDVPYNSVSLGTVSWIDVKPLGIEEFINNISVVKVFPNPAKTQITFVTKTNANYSLTITTIDGKLISQNNFTGNSYKLNLRKLPTGIYLYKLQNKKNDHVLNGKFVKE